jgi:hypothetical protein
MGYMGDGMTGGDGNGGLRGRGTLKMRLMQKRRRGG